ncbi:hypothetical protein JCM3765_000546 [Sporobolomyces pararoseus]
MSYTYPRDAFSACTSQSRISSSSSSSEDNEYRTLTKLTRALMILAGYPIPEHQPVDLTSALTRIPTSLIVPSTPPPSNQDDSPTPSPSKLIRTRSSSPSINWLPPPSTRATTSSSSRSSSRLPSHKQAPSSILHVLPGANEELVEWTEPKTCRSWRGKMKRVENRVMEVIVEEDEAVEIESQGMGNVNVGPKSARKKRSKKRPRKRLSSFIRVYRDRREDKARSTSEEVLSDNERKRGAGAVLEEVEGNEQRKRRKRDQLPRQISDSSSFYSTKALSSCSSDCSPPSSSPEQAVRRKSFRELEEEAIALEQHSKLVWREEDPEHSTFDDDDDGDEVEEHDYLYGMEEEDGMLDWSLNRKE